MPQSKAAIFSQLQTEIHRMEGYKPANCTSLDMALGPIQKVFPKGSFPIGAVHEFLSTEKEDMAAVRGFIAGLISQVMVHQGATLWISANRQVFPPALANYGIQPEQLIFVDVQHERDIMPVFYEALKCSAISAVVAESRNLDFTTSRRLQLAVEKSQSTGFVIRSHVQKLNPTACVSRWKISSLPSESFEGLPGIGFPKWQVELLRMRNGKIGVWDVQWIDGKFASIRETSIQKDEFIHLEEKQRQTG